MMSSQHLVKLIQDFLDAEVRAEQASRLGEPKDFHDTPLATAKRALDNYLDTAAHDSEDRPLVIKAKAYLKALADLRGAMDANADILLPSEQLYDADHALQDMLYLAARGALAEGNRHLHRMLVAINNDNHSQRSMCTAIHLAEHLPATLKLIHVVPALPKDSDEKEKQSHSDLHRRGTWLLKQAKSCVPSDIPCDTLLLEGDPVTQIISTARRWGADFIVLGTRGRGRVSRAFHLSVAEQVVCKATCPVITVGHVRFDPSFSKANELCGTASQTM